MFFSMWVLITIGMIVALIVWLWPVIKVVLIALVIAAVIYVVNLIIQKSKEKPKAEDYTPTLLNGDPMWEEPEEQEEDTGLGVAGAVLMGLSMLSEDSDNGKVDDGHCDGDCANCPPHYGYRYGRWYYGHGHRYGCQRGGNGGAKGWTSRD